jgi:flagellar hook protein FlgE
MRIESALYTSGSGIDAHGQAIAVIGDNISNVNTTGFKAARAEFQDIFTEGGGGQSSVAGPVTGGGAVLDTVKQLYTSGGLDDTGRGLDAAIDGTGFFVVGSVDDAKYTRAGNFQVDAQGLLVSDDGAPVLGYTNGGTTLSTISLNTTAVVSGAPTTSLGVSGNLASTSSLTSVPTTPPTTFSELSASTSYQSVMEVYDSLGKSHPLTLSFYRTAPSTWTVQAHMDGGDLTGGTAGVPVQVGANTTLTFNPSGKIDDANKAAAKITLAPQYSGGAAAGAIALDLSDFSQYAAASATASIVQDGRGTGVATSYNIAADGVVNAVMSNGQTLQMGTLALANFTNENGLVRAGSNDFLAGFDVGTRALNKPGTSGSGKIKGGALESSTVDIGKEFVTMISYQRGYQANSQVFTSTADLIRQTIQMIK